MFADVNIWGVDYNGSLDNVVSELSWHRFRWLTPVGPLTFSLTTPITKESTDIEETFRFNIKSF